MADKELVDMLNNARQERLFVLERQLELLLNHQFAAEIAQRKVNFTAADSHGEIVPGLGLDHQPDAGTPAAPRLLDFRLLNQMRFEHFTHDFCNAGRRQLRKTGEVDARHRAKLINQAIYCSCIGLLYLIDMAWLTVRYHH